MGLWLLSGSVCLVYQGCRLVYCSGFSGLRFTLSLCPFLGGCWEVGPRLLVKTTASKDKGAAFAVKLLQTLRGQNLQMRPFGYNPSCVSARFRALTTSRRSIGLSA